MILFGKRTDRFFLYLPVFFVIASIAHIISIKLLNTPIGKRDFYLARLIISDYLFFNTIHVPLTFVVLATIPEFKHWAKLTKISGPFNFWINALLVFLLSTTLIYLGGGLLPNSANNFLFFINAMLFKNLMSNYHAVGQCLGISTIINQKYLTKKCMDNNLKILKLRRFEGLIATFIIWIFTFTGFYVLSSENREVGSFSKLPILILLILSVSLVMSAFRYPKEIRFLKFKYLIRYLLWPLQLITPIALTARQMNHGLENMLVLNNIYKNSINETQKKFLKFSIFIIFIWVLIGLPRALNQAQLLGPSARIFFSITWAIDITHYWADRVVYRMRDKTTRDNHGHLLF